MKKYRYLPLVIASAFVVNGCDYFKSKGTTVGSSYNYEDTYTIKSVKVPENSRDIEYKLDLKNPYIDLIDGLDSDNFTVSNGAIKLNIVPNYSNPKDVNGDNIYEVKAYIVDENNNDFMLLLKIEVTKAGGGSGGGEDNHTVSADSDHDFIPDAIEKYLGKDSNNSDENANGILDGLEGDPLYSKQWYIKALGTATNPSDVPSVVGNDLDLDSVYSKYMGYNGGNPVILQIVDSGVDIKHEDLKDNIDSSRSLNGTEVGDPEPGGIFMPHGTMLAGIAAARAFNGKGLRGVAPFAKIAGSNWLVNQSLDGLEAAWYSGAGANEIAVTNNSWGTYYTVDTFYEDIMEQGANDLRDGKGRVYVFASGNARTFNADSNVQYVINNRYALVVSAIEHDNKVASYSTPGANVWITAYGGSVSYDEGPTIATTYLSGESTKTWEVDNAGNYTYAMAGSSAAAPMVTGSVALLLEACPNLGWRDVKYILAKSAKQVDSQSQSWITNAAGIHFSRDYGFGLVDTKAAIDMCEKGYSNFNTQKWVSSTLDTNSSVGEKRDITVERNKDMKIEWVETTVDIDTESASDLDIYLTSPSGTKVQLVKSGTQIGENLIPNSDWMKGGFRFSTGAFLDENSTGDWIVEIVNTKTDSATVKKATIKIYGH